MGPNPGTTKALAAVAIHHRANLILPLAWFVLIAASLAALEAYKARPGEMVAASGQSHAAPPVPEGTLRILLFAHPLCPCTRATLHELRLLVEQAATRPTVEIVMRGYDGLAPPTPLVELAQAIPGATVRALVDDQEPDRYGARTSGHVVVLDGRGRELFRGGITRSRGHEGSNPGSRAVAALLSGRAIEVSHFAVFGCRLLNEEQHPAAATTGK